MSGQTPISGYVLTASDSSGDTTWASPGAVGGWTVSGTNVYETSGGNVGIGTNLLTTAALTVMNGNVGIGTWIPATMLDVNGSVRMTGLTLTGNGAAAGNVLVTNAVGVGTWMPAGTLASTNYWNYSAAGNIGVSTIQAVGIGTTYIGGTGEAALSVMNGNVGIGTWVPAAPLAVGANAFTVNTAGAITAAANTFIVNSTGAITAVTGITTTGGYTQTGGGINNFSGNVGLGSATPGQRLDVTGTVRTIGFTMSGQTPISGYVLTASDSSGDTTWSSPGTVGGWTVSGTNVYETSGGNVGIGTNLLTTAALTVMNGNVGIGTWIPATMLDVNGSVRMTGLTLTGNGAASGNVLVTNGVGVGTWMPASTLPGTGASNYWLNDITGNVGISTTYAVGIGTSFVGGTGEAALSIMNGNVGIGTWVPAAPLAVGANAFTVSTTGAITAAANTFIVNSTGAITAVTGITTTGSYTQTGGGINNFSGNVGLGSATPGQRLDITGTVRTIGFTMSGQTPISGYVLTASDSAGDTTWSSPGAVGGWTVSGVNVYETSGGNVGIGTNLVTTAALTVMNGNVGIGTWIPATMLDVNGSVRMTGLTLTGNGAASGNVLVTNAIGVGTWMPAGTLASTNYWNYSAAGNIGVSTIQAVGIGTTYIGGTGEAALSVMNGNVGIGTWIPAAPLAVGANAFTVSTTGAITAAANTFIVNSTGAITAVTGITTTGGYTQTGGGINNFSGNVGLGSATPGQRLDVTGTVRTIGFTMSGQTPISGYVLTASDSSGDTTWSSPGAVGGWTVSGTNVYETSGGNVGIGTNLVTTAALTVMNGNVGIGTWIPAYSFDMRGPAGGNWGFIGEPVGANAAGLIFGANSGSGEGSQIQFMSNHNNGALNPLTIASGSGAEVDNIISMGNSTPLEFTGANIGIGTVTPGQVLDVNGTVRMTGLTLTGNGAASGNVLVTNGVGVGTWMAANTLLTQSSNYWLNNIGGNVGINTTYAVGIGTSFVGGTGEAALSIMNGNVGIGTWVPAAPLAVGANAFTVNTAGAITAAANTFIVNSTGAITAVTGITTTGAYTQSGNGINAFSGNVGLGSATPGQRLDITGTVRTIGFTMSGQTPISGYVLTASDSSGDTTWASPGAVGGWTVSGTNVYETSGGNVGIGTNLLTTAALTVMNGNVGIGTWIPATMLDVNGSVRMTGLTLTGNGAAAGNVLVTNAIGVGTWMPTGTLGTISGLTTNYVTKASSASSITNSLIFDNGVNVGIGSANPGAALDVNGMISVEGAGNSYFSSNVGIGSTAPGQAIDVNGTVRMTGLTLTGNGAASGNVLVTNGIGVGTWMPASTLPGTGASNYWLNDITGNVGISTTYAVGIGTSFVGGTGEAALSIMNGNVGIGTWVPKAQLDVEGTLSTTYFAGNVGIGTIAPSANFGVQGNSVLGSVGSSTDNITSSGTGSFAGGNAIHTTGNIGSILASSTGSFAFGYTQGNAAGGNGSIISNNAGSIAMGNARTGGTLEATNPGAIALGYAESSGTINSGNEGSIALGAAFNGTIESTAIGDFTVGEANNANIESTTNSGAIAMGFANGGNIEATGSGSIAMGYSTSGTMQATGTASVAIGQNVQATQNNAFALGESIISNGTNSFGIGLDSNARTISASNVMAIMGGNLGIGSLVPGQALDVTGTVRTIGFTMSGQTPISGYVLTASDSSGDTTWASPGAVGGWTVSGTNVYETSGGNVGIGTNLVTTAALTVMNGNVGIGTWKPATMLDVNGSVRMTGLTLTGNGAASGNVLVTNGIGVGTWMPANTLTTSSQWITTNVNDVYLPNNGNVGIGTSSTNGGAAFTVMNGNVGIGTWAPATLFQVNKLSASPFAITASGNVGIGTVTPQGALVVTNGNVSIGTWVAAAALQVGGSNVLSSPPLQEWFATYSNSAGYPQILGSWAGNGLWGIGPASGANDDNLEIGATGTVLGVTWASADRLNLVIPNGNIGIGTVNTSTSALAVMGGNVGIGTFLPANMLSVAGGAAIGSGAYAITTGPANGLIVAGNVGIGSTTPGQALDINGTVRTIGFTMSGQTPISGYVLTASDSSGDTTWSSPGAVGGWTVSGNNVYETSGGNVGIGTTIVNQAALTVMNGNVGIGTWVPASNLDVNGNVRVGTALLSGSVISNGTSSIALGYSSAGIGDSGLIESDGEGSVAMGYILSTHISSLQASGNGSVAMGAVESPIGNSSLVSSSYGSIAMGLSVGTMSSSNDGSIALGYAGGGTFTSSGFGSIAMGESTNSNTLQATGTASVAIGENVQANANNSFALGNGVVNPTASSFMVGFSTTPALTVTNTTVGVGIGTYTTPSGGLVVEGNVGIGTFNPFGGGLIVLPASTGNVGIGSLAPGQALDVNGTVRMTGFTLNQNPGNGYVIVGNGVGVGTWMPASSLTTSSQWVTTNVNDVYLPNSGNVGIGTSFTNAGGALDIMNGNVGIGTWAPTSTLSINGSIAVRAVTPGSYPYSAATNDQVILASAASGNVQINLPAVATVPGREYIIKKTDATANTITIQANGAETIDGQNTIAENIQYQSYTIVSDGNHWYVL
jgi:hypothetical protein